MCLRFFIFCGLLLVSERGLAADAKSAEDFTAKIRPFLQQHCFACHGEAEQQSNLRYDRLQEFRRGDQHLWTLIHEQVATGQMPPTDAPQPVKQERQEFLHWVEKQQEALKTSGTRRLNRRELSAALRDLTGLDIDYSQGLPGDGRVDGFDTGADALQDAADSVGQIMQVTQRAVEALRFLEPSSGPIYEADLVTAKDARRAFDPWKKQGLRVSTNDTVSQQGTGLFLKPKWLGERGGLRFTVQPPDPRFGVLRLQLDVSAKKFRDDLPDAKLWVEVGGRDLAYLDITNPTTQPRRLVFDVQLSDVALGSKGLEITLSNRVEVPYEVEGFANEDKAKLGDSVPGGPGLFRPVYDKKGPFEDQPVPYLVLHSIAIQPEYRPTWPPADWKVDVGDLGDNLASAQHLLKIWMDRAWRRPVNENEQKRFLKLYENLREQKLSFDEALRATFQSVLLSGSFRFLPSPGDVDKSLKQHAIASRLSFLLWGRPPDAELRQLAIEGKLTNPTVLDAQVDRLLSDPRSQDFVRPFVTQWLEMDQPITIAMDHIQKQDFRFGRNLKASMKQETVSYFAQILRENRSAQELLASDWTMMNDVLAKHYGYVGIEGAELRKVKLRKGDRRGGGILAHAGIQSMLCWMGENWVIYRGAWTLRNILDDPPPPPPLEVPELLPSDGKNHGKTFKELLNQHQADSRCAVCHKVMDPLGFAFQNFDLSGRWRDVEYDHYVMNDLDGKIEWRGAGKTRPVDVQGRLPRGEGFATFAECKQLLVQHYTDDFAQGLMKNWFLYATGRKPNIADRQEIREILAASQSKNYPLRDLLKTVVRSKAFLER